jgi:uncharacterized protein
MIPEFPNFKSLDVDDRDEIDSFVRRFPPYSDFNATSLTCYDTERQFELSYLHGNLVVKMVDYLTAKPFYTLLGTNRVADTIGVLLDRSESLGIDPVLRLIPECCLQDDAVVCKGFAISEDPDSFDYLYSMSAMTGLTGGDFQRKRKRIASFQHTWPQSRVKAIDITDASTCRNIVRLLDIWQERKHKADSDVEMEFAAIRRCLQYSDRFHLDSFGLEINGDLVGFSICEAVGDCLMLHFLKVAPQYPCGTDVLLHETIKSMSSRGCGVMNCQQDLGIPGLRFWKESWRPVRMLKKYTIRRTEAI